MSNINREEFKEVVKPVVEWMHKSSTPHDTIIIRQDGAELVCGEMAVSFEVPD
jgi:hypothetical protein